jgi:putative ABC transport system ATP-binding protein
MSLLKVNQLKKSFSSPEGENINVVDVDNFALTSSEFCGMRGESGSGKTTFLHLLAGILSPDDGLIELEGQNTVQMNSSEKDSLRAGTIGYVFQSFNLLQGFSCLENLKLAMSFAGRSDHQYAIDLLDRVGLSKRLHYYPHQLSIGQQQRVALARALVNQPKLVLADEPTGNLDPLNACKAIELLHELCQEANSALLVVSHDDAIIQSFERQVDWGVINRSRVINPLAI